MTLYVAKLMVVRAFLLTMTNDDEKLCEQLSFWEKKHFRSVFHISNALSYKCDHDFAFLWFCFKSDDFLTELSRSMYIV